MAFRTTLVGLGLVGSSIGLALREAGAGIEIIGHDKDNRAAKRAHKSGCVDRTEWNLISACDGADLIVISTPLAGVKSTLAAIAQDLKEGCVVTDTASLKVPVLKWAHESLPSTVHFVGGHPIIEEAVPEPVTPTADLFSGAIYCLIPDTSTPPEALQAVSDLAEAVGAKPYYLDAAEHDGLIAAVEQVPLLLALALQVMAGTSSSRREMIRLSGVDLTNVTQLLAGDAEKLTELCTLNATNVVRWLDAFLPQLSNLREILASQDSESLQKSFAAALETREGWARKRVEGEEVDYSDFGATRMMLGDSFGSRRQKSG
jgi:prephenate dehydrogenase